MNEKPHIGATLLILGSMGLLFTLLLLYGTPTNTVEGAAILVFSVIFGPICLLVALIGLVTIIVGWVKSRQDDYVKSQTPDDTTDVSGE
jgi:hypothetical protein